MTAVLNSELQAVVDKVTMALEEKDEAQVAAGDTALKIDFEEHFAFQGLQSSAFAAGRIKADMAGFLYTALGEVWTPSNGGWAADTTTAEKYVATQLLGELMRRELAMRMGRPQ